MLQQARENVAVRLHLLAGAAILGMRAIGSLPMSTPRTILVPYDFSARSEAALKLADEMASQQGAQLKIIHVQIPLEFAFLDGVYHESPQALADAHQRAQAQLAEVCAKLQTPEDRRATNVLIGHPVEVIVQQSDDADLIIMSTHGRKGLEHWVLGSVAERVVRAARCSVYIVKHRDA